jgi:hypothetical protein
LLHRSTSFCGFFLTNDKVIYSHNLLSSIECRRQLNLGPLSPIVWMQGLISTGWEISQPSFRKWMYSGLAVKDRTLLSQQVPPKNGNIWERHMQYWVKRDQHIDKKGTTSTVWLNSHFCPLVSTLFSQQNWLLEMGYPMFYCQTRE